MDKIKLNVHGLSVSQTQTGTYALVLGEENGTRRIPIIIGPIEAQSIALELEGLETPRPLTHDLFKTFADSFDITLKQVYIYRLEEGVFYSELHCKQGDKEVKIDSRTSDAISLALRFQSPIFTSEVIIEKAGIVIDVEDDEKEADETNDPFDIENPFADSSGKPNLNNLSEEELQTVLQAAIAAEDYERASEIRDELAKREASDK